LMSYEFSKCGEDFMDTLYMIKNIDSYHRIVLVFK
jgi:hypothetical protein